ncbi:OTU-domain-containing protein [Pisolithus albus]|nr:OTU-domain-containing protein [Pisolithus albus]
MVKKRNKATKAGQTQVLHAPAPLVVEDEQLVTDLFAALANRDEQLTQETATIPQVSQTKTTSKKQDSKARHLARQARKAAALAQYMPTTDPAADAQVEWETKQETALINRTCDELGVQIHEINPDGHCLFSAIADQLAILNILPPSQANYATVRAAAADYMLRHPADFLPFIPSISGEDGVGATADTGLMSGAQFERYCLSIRDTGAWGGEPEILALSRAFNIPILVVQGGNPPIVTHNPGDVDLSNRHAKAARISFHRRKYGLGEVSAFVYIVLSSLNTAQHYNSLRPKHTLATVTDKIQSIFV